MTNLEKLIDVLEGNCKSGIEGMDRDLMINSSDLVDELKRILLEENNLRKELHELKKR